MSNFEKAYMDEVNYFIDYYLEDEFEDEDDKKVLKEITDEDKKQVVEMLLNDNEINQAINEGIRYYLFHRKGV